MDCGSRSHSLTNFELGVPSSAWQAEGQPSAKSRSKWASSSASATNIRFPPPQTSYLLTKSPPWKVLCAPGEGVGLPRVTQLVGDKMRTSTQGLRLWPRVLSLSPISPQGCYSPSTHPLCIKHSHPPHSPWTVPWLGKEKSFRRS